MVMIFANKKVRDYLLSQGTVYTYRKTHRKTLDGIRPQIGKDWATDRRGGTKIADIFITPMEPIDSQNMSRVLRKYARDSGFYERITQKAINDWAQAIQHLNPFAPRAGWIYKVEVIGADS